MRALARLWARSRRGSILVEFSLVAPVLVAMMLASVEVGAMIAAKSRASDVAMTIGDLVTQNKVMDATRMGDLFKAADATLESGMLQAGTGSKIEVRVTSAISCACKDDSSKNCFTSLWSHDYVDGQVRDGYPGDTDLPQIPSELAFNQYETLVMTEVSYEYDAPITFILDDEMMTFSERAFHRPRFSTNIEHTGQQAEASRRTCPSSDNS